MRDVYIAGEDEATRAVIERLINDYAPNLHIVSYLPARGSQVRSSIPMFNQLANYYPVILLADLDDEVCAPIYKKSLLCGISKCTDFIINLAVDEVEAWLMADREGFSDYFGIPLESVPESKMQKMSGPKALPEMDVQVKSSWLFTHKLIHLSDNKERRAQIAVGTQDKNSKGKEYNTAVIPFIKQQWSPERARIASDSLNRMILRLSSM